MPLPPKPWTPNPRTLRDYLYILARQEEHTLSSLEKTVGQTGINHLRYLDFMKTREWIGAKVEDSKKQIWIEAAGSEAFTKLNGFLRFVQGPGLFADHLAVGQSPPEAIDRAIELRKLTQEELRRELERRIFGE